MISRLVRRNWTVVVAVVVVALAAFAVYRIQGMFDSRQNASTSAPPADQIVPFNPKRVLLEVYGTPGASATITYLDVEAHPRRVDTALPWSYQDSTTTPAVLTNIQAQSDSDTLGCRITIDGVVKVERSAEGADAYVYCLDKSG